MASTEVRARPSRARATDARPFLPPTPGLEQPVQLGPQLAFRLALLGVVVLAVFAVLFFRLWSLQILSGPQYLQAARDNQLRTVPVAAPRGTIVDRNGKTLVDNVAGSAVQIWPADLPKSGAARLAELRRLSKIVHVPVAAMVAAIRRRAGDVVDPVTVKESVHEDQISYLQERQAEFPGVEIGQAYLRHYPYQALGAQLLGYVGEISPAQLRQLRGKGYRAGSQIGQGGVESTYDAYLRGQDGLAQLRVDSLGRPRSAVVTKESALPGQTLRLTIDIDLQRAAERALRYGIGLAHQDGCTGCWAADGGAIVALDPNDGSVLAMASNPTYKPSVFAGRGDPTKLAPLLNPAVARHDNYPALDRPIQGVYPAGSTFKPVTALAALEERVITPYDALPCTGKITIAKQVFKNWDPYVSTLMTLPTALAASCDTFFYQLGYDFYKLPPERGHPLQAWARRFGFGQPSGIDIGPESKGLLPTPEWKRATFTPKTDPRNWRIDRLWKPGDSVQLAIGQKDTGVTPMQLARFYALIANGGELVRPHVVEDVEQSGNERAPGQILHRFVPVPPQRIRIDPLALATVRDGLYQATHSPDGTSAGVFSSFPIPIAGKTGTAEKYVQIPGYSGLMDQSWWCGYGPAGPTEKPQLVVCALIENGGHGATAAAPAALKVFEQYFQVNGNPRQAYGD